MLGGAATCLGLLGAAVLAAAAGRDVRRAPLVPVVGEVPFSPVLGRRPRRRPGDGRQLQPAGGRRLAGDRWLAAADVDGDTTLLCIGRRYVPAACADNSSSATLDIPAGARVVQARLYVDSTLTVGGRARCVSGSTARPPAYEYTELATHDPAVPKVYEGSGGGARPAGHAPGGVGRHRLRGGRPVPARTPSPTSSTSGPAPGCPTPRGRSSSPTSSIRRPASCSTELPGRASSASPRGRSPGTTGSSCAPRGPSTCPSPGTRSWPASRRSPRASTSSPTPRPVAPTTCCSTVARSATT